MDYKQAFQKEYSLQTGTEEGSVDSDDLILLNETEHYWIIKNTRAHDDQREILNVVWKDGHRRMESIEL
jgi:hypothetical protein